MNDSVHPPTARLGHEDAALVAYLRGRSAPCPRCAYDLKNITTAQCPECGEPLVLTVGTPRARFGWLVLAMAPGCFSGVAAVFVLVPVFLSTINRNPPPWPIVIADGFGFFSAVTVALMYRHRHRFMSWTARRQGLFAGAVWGVHVLMLALVLFSVWYWY